MKHIKSLFIALTLVTTSAYGIGFGFDLGPFNLQLDAPVGGYIEDRDTIVDDPICDAIENRQQLAITVEGVENVSTKEKKIVTKRVIVEPYAFGVTKQGAPVLRGNVVEEKMLQEVSLKYGDDMFDEATVPKDSKDKGFFSGLFSSDNKTNIDIRKVSVIEVIEGSHFDAPKDFKGLEAENIDVICQLPVAGK